MEDFAKKWVEYPLLAMPANTNSIANAQCEQTLTTLLLAHKTHLFSGIETFWEGFWFFPEWTQIKDNITKISIKKNLKFVWENQPFPGSHEILASSQFLQQCYFNFQIFRLTVQAYIPFGEEYTYSSEYVHLLWE